MSEHQLADRAGFPVDALRAMRVRREGPPYHIVGGAVRYGADALAWAERHHAVTLSDSHP